MNKFDPFAGNVIERTVDSTEAQREIWLAANYGGDQANLAYNESVSMTLDGDLDVAALRAAASQLVIRHDALRSTFSTDGQTLVVNQTIPLDFQIEDFTRESVVASKSLSKKARNEEVTKVFDLGPGPLIRFRLLIFSRSSAELILTAHHIVCDGWSLGVLISELDTLYASHRVAGEDLEPAPSFADHAVAERNAISGQKAVTTEIYWTKILGSKPPELDLPTDFPRKDSMVELDGVPTRSVSAKRYNHTLSSALSADVEQAAKSSGAGMTAFLLAAFSILLGRLSSQKDFIVGVPSAAQAQTGNFKLVGHCVQLLPIRVQLDSNTAFQGFARSVKSSLLDGFNHQGLTFGTLLQRFKLLRDPSRVPLIPLMFNVDQEMRQDALGNCGMELRSNPRVSENFEIFLNITPHRGQLTLEITYRTGLFREQTIREWCESFETALTKVSENPASLVRQIKCLSDRQKEMQLSRQSTELDDQSEGNTTALERITEIALENPDLVAVQDQFNSISYRDLIVRSNSIASDLLAAGVASGSRVAICRAAGIDLVTGLLGIWRSGCSYVPLDPSYPQKRLRFVLEDTDVKVILGEGEKPEFANTYEWLTSTGVDHEEESENSFAGPNPQATDIAYVIHTSGSTGAPKGVVIDHAAFNNFIDAMIRRPGICPDSTLVAVTSLSFDISTLEIFLPLSVGAKVVLASKEQSQDGFALARLLDTSGANFMQATPSGWRALLDAGWQGNKDLKALCGGENLPVSLARALSEKVGELWNMYGPTEATVWSHAQSIAEPISEITLGKSVTNTTAYVLDREMNLLPPGASGGELYLGGAGLSQGYLGRAEMTAEKFVENPFSKEHSDRLFRTGDRVKLDSEGQLHFLGRLDHQVKIRGFRIELSEIESVLLRHQSIGMAVAILRQISEADHRLIAYVTASGRKQPSISELFALLEHELPPQCIPQHILVLERIPQTDSGKIDRNALPDPEIEPVEVSGELTTGTQHAIASIWCDLLRLDRVGPFDDFFLLGGHSMLAVRMLARVRDHFNLELPLQTIFHDRNIANLAARLDLISTVVKPVHEIKSDNLEVFEF